VGLKPPGGVNVVLKNKNKGGEKKISFRGGKPVGKKQKKIRYGNKKDETNLRGGVGKIKKNKKGGRKREKQQPTRLGDK